MNRKSFLKGTAALGAMAGITIITSNGANVPIRGCNCTGTSFADNSVCDEELGFARTWIKRLLNNLDKEWNEESRKKLLRSCGESCHLGHLHSTGNPASPALSLDKFTEMLNKPNGVTFAECKGTSTAILSYVKRTDGQNQPLEKCLCPMVASGTEGLSGTYCQCSVGYVKSLFEWGLGQAVAQVRLIESLKTGGNICRFEIVV
jgi:hypothetical protein